MYLVKGLSRDKGPGRYTKLLPCHPTDYLGGRGRGRGVHQIPCPRRGALPDTMSLPIWTFFVLFGTFPICSGISPICPAIVRGFSRFVPFPIGRSINSTYEEQSRKGPRHNLDLSRKNGKPPGLETPGLASPKLLRLISNSAIALICFSLFFFEKKNKESQQKNKVFFSLGRSL